MARTMGVQERAGVAVIDSVAAALRSKHVLLVVDNCEHLRAACGRSIDALLRGCPGLVALATSREPLHTPGEVVWSVPPLGLPSQGSHRTRLEQAATADAVRLFVERAQAAQPRFQLTAANVGAVVQVCRELDGIPLALELAAARVRYLAPHQIAGRLDHRFELLVGGSELAPPRQQTLRATLDWSYSLLDERERTLLNRLSVFAGSFTLGAAEIVGAEGRVLAADIILLLGRLVDRSLVQVEAGSGSARYRLLETVRQYSAERLLEAAETESTFARHLQWCLTIMEAVQPQRLALEDVELIETEYDNIRAVLTRVIERRQRQEGLQIGQRLWVYWYIRGQYAEGRYWLGQLLSIRHDESPSSIRSYCLSFAAHMTYAQGDLDTARPLAEKGRSMARAAGDPVAEGLACQVLGNIARGSGDLALAASLHRQAATILGSAGSWVWQSFGLHSLSAVFSLQGNDEAAEAYARETLSVIRRHGNVLPTTAGALETLGMVAMRRGDLVEARRLLEEAVSLDRRLGVRQFLTRTLRALGQVHLTAGDSAAAFERFNESIRLARDAGDLLELARNMDALAESMAADDPVRAVRLSGAAERLRCDRSAVPFPIERERLEHWQRAARQRIGGAAFDNAHLEGLAMSLEDALDLCGQRAA
jgi:predicted ATPase